MMTRMSSFVLVVPHGIFSLPQNTKHNFFLFSPEEKIKIMEKKVNDLIEESCLAHARGDLQQVGLFAINPQQF